MRLVTSADSVLGIGVFRAAFKLKSQTALPLHTTIPAGKNTGARRPTATCGKASVYARDMAVSPGKAAGQGKWNINPRQGHCFKPDRASA